MKAACRSFTATAQHAQKHYMSYNPSPGKTSSHLSVSDRSIASDSQNDLCCVQMAVVQDFSLTHTVWLGLGNRCGLAQKSYITKAASFVNVLTRHTELVRDIA